MLQSRSRMPSSKRLHALFESLSNGSQPLERGLARTARSEALPSSSASTVLPLSDLSRKSNPDHCPADFARTGLPYVSVFCRGVTRHSNTGRYEAHLWDADFIRPITVSSVRAQLLKSSSAPAVCKPQDPCEDGLIQPSSFSRPLLSAAAARPCRTSSGCEQL